jgi:hypothetical protein
MVFCLSQAIATVNLLSFINWGWNIKIGFLDLIKEFWFQISLHLSCVQLQVCVDSLHGHCVENK